MILFPFGTDVLFTLIPRIGEEVLTESDMIGLSVTISINNRFKSVSFTPLWRWNDRGIEIEVQRDLVKSPGEYSISLDWRRADSNFSDGFQDIMNACAQVEFSTSCSVVSDKTIIVEMGLNYAVINVVDELPERGNPGEFYATVEVV